MKVFFKLLVAVFCLGLLTHCSHGDLYKKEIGTIDSLLIQMDSAEKVFWSLDSAALNQAYKKVNKTLGHITDVIQDTLEKEEGMLLSQYRGIRKPIKEYLQKIGSMQKECTVTRKQLNDLRHDLEKELMTKEDVDIHFTKETGLARLLINSMRITSETMNMYLTKFNQLNPRVDSLVQVKESQLLPKSKP